LESASRPSTLSSRHVIIHLVALTLSRRFFSFFALLIGSKVQGYDRQSWCFHPSCSRCCCCSCCQEGNAKLFLRTCGYFQLVVFIVYFLITGGAQEEFVIFFCRWRHEPLRRRLKHRLIAGPLYFSPKALQIQTRPLILECVI
jgi:hypothetical protein